LQPLHAVQRLLDRPRDGDLHLIDGRHAVVDADEHAREVHLGKDRDRNGRGEIDARRNERQDDEDDRFAVAAGPVLVTRDHSFSSFSSGPAFSPGFITRTLALSSNPRPPTVTTRSPGATPVTTCTRSSSLMPMTTFFSCATSLSSTVFT